MKFAKNLEIKVVKIETIFNHKNVIDMKHNFTTRFYLKSGKKNSKGQSPIYFRMTYYGQRIELAAGKSIISENWNKNLHRSNGSREEIRVLNNYLDNLQIRANIFFNKLVEVEEYFVVTILNNILIGINKTPHGDRYYKELANRY